MSTTKECKPEPSSLNQVNTQSPNSHIKFVPTRREADSLCIDNYLFQRVSGRTNKDGSISWRCKEYRSQIKCQSTCRIGVDRSILRRPAPHTHPCYTDAALVLMKAKADAKKRCRTEDTTSVKTIFLQEIGKAILNNGIQLTDDEYLNQLPSFRVNRGTLTIQQKRKSRWSMSESCDDQRSMSSVEEAAAEDLKFSEVVRKPKKARNIDQLVNDLWESRLS